MEKKVFTRENIKAFSVLVVIAVLCASLLAVLNGVLYVSEDEKDARALLSVWNSPTTKLEVVADYSEKGDYGCIMGVYSTEDGNFIFKSKGYHGYQDGYMLCYIVVTKSGEIKAVSVGGNESQSLANSVKKTYLAKTYVGRNVVNDNYYIVLKAGVTANAEQTGISPVSGATMSSAAVMNSINMVKYYVSSTNVLEVSE